MKINAFIIIITLQYFNLTLCDRNIKCNGTILFDHYNVSKSDQKEKKLDIYCGDEIMLLCQLDEISLQTGCLSSNLTYEFGIGDMRPETTDTQLVNDKTLQLKMITDKPAGFTVTCLYNGKGLNGLVMSINVGREPQPIQIHCLVYPYINKIRCEFEMSGNPVLEKYSIMYSNHSTQPAIYNKAVFERQDKKRKWATDLPEHTKFDPFGKYTFLVNGTNRFGELLQNFTFHTEQIVVIPNAISNKILSRESKSVLVEIKLPAAVQMYDFIYNVKACTVRCDKEKNWLPVTVTGITTHATEGDFILNLNISQLYAFQSNKLQIKIQPKDALYPTKQQITVKPRTFKTLECPPDNPPTTFSNGFEIRENNKLIVYWKEVLDLHKNGPEFKYEISEIYENGELLSNEKMNLTILSNSTGRLANFNSTKNYTIRMVSRNSAGVSDDRSDEIEIPKAIDWVSPPAEMRKTIFHDTYELSWKNTFSHNILSYTIYWCNALDEIQSMCGTLLGYKTLPGHQTAFQYYNTAKNDMKNFAIAANTKNSSSGLFWFTCSEKSMPEVTHITHSNITLNWTMPCHTNRKNHVIISYCECGPYTNTTCGTNRRNLAVTNIDQESITLSKLNQCTSYLIKIQDLYLNSTNPLIINARTTKGMPPTPMALESGIITNTTIEITWSLPYECSGPMWYNITYNRLNYLIYQNNSLKFHTIKNLSSFSIYDIKLAACYDTTQCSNFSQAISLKTKYGSPAGIDKFTSITNGNDFTYSWQPSLQNAEFQYYEVKHSLTHNSVSTELTSIVFNPKCKLVVNPCDDGATNFKYFIRVINTDRMINNSYSVKMNNTFSPNICFEEISYNISTLCDQVACMVGKWNECRDFYCSPENLIMKYTVIFVVILAFGAGLCAGIVVGVRKYRSIKNVGHVSMPEGLDSIFKSRSNLIQKLESPSDDGDESKDEYCTYEYIFSSVNRLDEISVSESIATIEKHDDYLEYSFDVVPLPNPGNYVKLNDLQNHSKIPTSEYTSISTLQPLTLLSHSPQPKVLNQNGYLPISAISTILTAVPVKMNGYVPIQMLQTMKPQMPSTISTGYTPVTALQHNTTKLPVVPTNGYITIAAIQSQSS